MEDFARLLQEMQRTGMSKREGNDLMAELSQAGFTGDSVAFLNSVKERKEKGPPKVGAFPLPDAGLVRFGFKVQLEDYEKTMVRSACSCTPAFSRRPISLVQSHLSLEPAHRRARLVYAPLDRRGGSGRVETSLCCRAWSHPSRTV